MAKHTPQLWQWGVRTVLALFGVAGLMLLIMWLIPRGRDLSSEQGAYNAPAKVRPISSQEPAPIRFTDVTAAAGIQFTHVTGATGRKWYPETIGSGVGFVDYDHDGWPDILLVNGTFLDQTSPAATTATAPTLRLYRNRGDGSFEDVTARAGMDVPVYGMGVAVADYDNDGDHDVLITGYQRHLFFVNNADGTFTEARERVGIGQGEWGAGAAFFDYDRDGHLDLVISNYVQWTPALEQGLDCTYGTPEKDYCPVRYFKGQGLRLYRNRGDGMFEETTHVAGVRAQGTRAFAPYIVDFDEDQWPDIFVASDGTPSRLYRNRGDGTFEDVGVRSGIVLDAGGAAYAGMGIDATYPQNDAQLCIAIGNFVGEPTTLHCRVRHEASYHPELYTEVSAWAGIGRPTLRSVTFGLFFFDADLDGFDDLFMVNGHVIDEARLRHAPRAQPPQLFRNLGNGQFAEVQPPSGSGLDTLLVGRGAAYADYDGDGDLDLIVSQNQGPALLLRNDTPRQGRFLRVRLQGTTSNRDGIGAVVRVHTGDHVRQQMLRLGRSYFSQPELTLTFGLGNVDQVERVEVLWPSGTVDIRRDVEPDTTLEVIESQQTHPPPNTQLRSMLPARLPHTSTHLPDATTSRAYLDLTQIGIQAYHAKRYADAARAFEAAIELRAVEPLPYRYLADLYWRQGATAQSAHTVRALAKVLPDAYFLDRLGNAFEEDNLLGLAILLYREAVRVDPNLPSAHYNLGRAYLRNGKLQDGIIEVHEALRLYPEFPDAHLTLGLAYTEQGHLDQAITHLQQALQVQPNLAQARNHLGRIYMAQGRLDEAIDTFETLVKQDPTVAEARHNLAVASARHGRKQQAIAQFRQALALQPDLHAARIDMAMVLLEIGQPQQAIAALQTVLHSASEATQTHASVDTVEIRYALGLAHLMAGHREAAKQQFALILQQRPTHASAHVSLARLSYQGGHFEQAWHHARQAESLGAPVADLIAALRRVSVEPP